MPPTDPIWEREPHTAAKHQIIEYYMQAWLPILLSTKLRQITYAEGFSGPGVYLNGEAGSPVIVYRAAREALAGRTGKSVSFVLVEGSRERLDILRGEMAKAGDPDARLPVVFEHGNCADQLIPALDRSKSFSTPIFALLDSWGGPVIPHEILPRISSTQSSEVLITFQPAFLARFGEVTQHRASGDRAFGGQHWQGVSNQPANRKYAFLVDAYRTSVRNAGFAYILSFELFDEQGHELHLVFGTNSPKGLEKMKDAMWKVDPIRGVRYRDPRDPDQEALEIVADPGFGPLRRLILKYIDSLEGPFTLKDLQDFALFETVYRGPHATEVVRTLLKQGHLERLDKGPLSLASKLRRVTTKPQRKSIAEQDALF